jgi:Collagen triple helix repeat (20 copies)
MKYILAAIAAIMLIPASAGANQGDPQNCEANPQQPFCGGSVTVEPATEVECPAGGFVVIVADVRYKVCNGVDGAPGTPGSNGESGPAGAAGATGSAGVDGAAGAAGTAGVTGTAGLPGVAGTDGVRGVAGTPSKARRAPKCERRLNRSGKLVVVCKRATCPRRASKANPRRLVVKCPPHRSKR